MIQRLLKVESSKLIKLLPPVIAAGYLFSLFNDGYFGVKFLEVLSFYNMDAWPGATNPIIGVHYFGDFDSITTSFRTGNPWLSETGYAYSPLASGIFAPFVLISFWSPTLAFCSFTITVLGLYLTPYVSAVSLSSLKTRDFFTSDQSSFLDFSLRLWPLVMISTPFIAALDRGNSVIFVGPLLWFVFAARVFDGDLKLGRKANVCLCFLSILKPQFAIFWLLRGKGKSLRGSLGLAIASVVAHLGSFVLLPSRRVESFAAWVNFVRSYNERLIPNDLGSRNISMLQGLLDLTTIFDMLIFEGSGVISLFVWNYASQINVVLFAIFSGIGVRSLRRGEETLAVVVIMLIGFCWGSISWMYYAMWMPVVLILALSLRDNTSDDGRSGLNFFIVLSLMAGSFQSTLLVSQIGVETNVGPYGTLSRLIVSTFGILLLLLLCLSGSVRGVNNLLKRLRLVGVSKLGLQKS